MSLTISEVQPGAESFQGLVLRFRGRTALTQGQVAARAHASLRSIQAWEAGISYPGTENLQALISCFLEAGGFARGREAAEAKAAEAEIAEPAPTSAVTAEWWFGSNAPATRPEPAAAPEPAPAYAESEPTPTAAPASPPVRALAERLSAEGREALARIEAQLAALDRLELAKRSLEWHEAQSAGGESEAPGPTPKG